jgi:hypothetical protein
MAKAIRAEMMTEPMVKILALALALALLAIGGGEWLLLRLTIRSLETSDNWLFLATFLSKNSITTTITNYDHSLGTRTSRCA